MTLQRILVITLLLSGFYSVSKAQCDLSTPPAPTCEAAPFLCLNQLCYFTEDTVNNCCNGWCGPNTIIDNPQYFAFIPTTACIEFVIHVDACSTGTGLQCGVVDACPWNNGNVLGCNPGANPGGAMVLQVCDLIPGSTYYLIIDGSNGSFCYYTFTSVTGIQTFPLTDSLDIAYTYADDTLVCPGYQDLVLNAGPSIPGVYYRWTFGWNGQHYDSDLPSISMDIEDNAPLGTWDVCVKAYNGCDSTNQVCFPITIATTSPVVKEAATFCAEEFPFLWHGQVIDGPGNYTATLYDKHNCSFDSLWTVMEYPVYSPGIIDTFVCNSQFQLGEYTFDQSGHYTLFLPNATNNGCDSILELDLTLGASDQFVELVCENDQPSLQVHIIAQDASIDTVTFEWYDCSFDSLLTTADTFFPVTAGCYGLVTHSGVCVDTLSSDYLITPCEINILCGLANTSGCADDTIWLTPSFPVPDGAQIHWLLGFDEPEFYIGNKDSLWAIFPFAGPETFQISYTIQDSNQTWTCQDQLTISTGPDVGICCDVSTCDTCAMFSIINFSSDPAFIFLNDGTIPPVTIPGVTSQTVCFPSMPLDSLVIGIIDVVSATNGCKGSVIGDDSITITQIPDPLVFIVDFTDSLCSYPNDLAAYRWRYCDSTTILSTSTCFIPTVSGCYCLEVENEIGCTFETCTDFIVSETSILPDDQIKITPNPSAGNITVELPSIPLPVEWQLTDMQGKFIMTGEMTTLKSELQLNPLSPGIYILKFDFGKNGIALKKMVIQ